MSPISRFHPVSLVMLAMIATMTPAAGQSKLTAKDVTARLTGSIWKLTTLWNTTDIRDDKAWVEAKMEETRYSDRFGIVIIQFFENGTFIGDHFDGRKIEGKWSFKEEKSKRKPLEFFLNYGDEAAEFRFEMSFQKLNFAESKFTAQGDICGDGCYMKVMFSKQ